MAMVACSQWTRRATSRCVPYTINPTNPIPSNFSRRCSQHQCSSSTGSVPISARCFIQKAHVVARINKGRLLFIISPAQSFSSTSWPICWLNTLNLRFRHTNRAQSRRWLVDWTYTQCGQPESCHRRRDAPPNRHLHQISKQQRNKKRSA